MHVKIEPPENVYYILGELSRSGYEAYIVGGCVRDALRGIEPKDWDIATSALPEETKRIFKKTYDTGIKHGTITVRIGSECYEVTTYRIDGAYEDMRRPSEVTFTRDISEDLRRRDFTMNAIAYNTEHGFVDPFGGIEDIKKRVIRAVMEPDERFKEDGLRMLRAVRFSAATDFNIDADTWEALKRNAGLIKHISAERVRDELVKTIMSDNLHRLPLLWESGLMSLILPKNSEVIYNNLDIKALSKCEKSVLLRLTLFLLGLRNDTGYVMKALRFDNKMTREVNVLINHAGYKFYGDKYSIRKLMSEIGTEAFFNVLAIKKCLGEDVGAAEAMSSEVLSSGDCVSLKELKINGDDLKAIGIKDGKVIGDTLKNLLEMVLRNPGLNDFDTLVGIILLNKS